MAKHFIFLSIFVGIFVALYPMPVSATFQAEQIEGWSVSVDDELKKSSPDLDNRIHKLLQTNLHMIAGLIPAKRLMELRRVPIYVWIGKGPWHHGSGAYYANGAGFSEGAVALDGIAGGVAIDDPETALTWLDNVPSGILHELSHAYHDQILGMDDPIIAAAYQNAVDKSLYLNVAHYDGQIVPRSYALTNKAEYFALLTQAYYWKSGFYPFTRDQLQSYDPVGYETVQAAWENHPGPQPAEKISLTGQGFKCQLEKQPAVTGRQQGKVIITIHNWTSQPLSFLWISGNGKKVAYKDIPPSGYRSQSTYTSQTWEIDSAGICFKMIKVSPLGNHIDILP